MIIGGLDIGSTGAKITVLDRSGNLRHTGYQAYPVNRDLNAHTIDARDIWAAVKTLLREAALAVPEMSAVGITSFGESFVLLNEAGEVLFPTMMYTDPRGGEEAELLRERVGGERICRITGTAAHSMYSLPKLMWIQHHEPAVFARAKYVCLIGDFLGYCLTGTRMIDYSLAARTMGFDIRAKEWSREIFAAAGIDPALFSRPVPSGTDAGRVRAGIAKELGLSPELRVVVCCHDQIAAAVGAGVTQAGIATDGGGTVQCLTPVFSPAPKSDFLPRHHYSIVPFLREDTYCCYAFSFTGGALVKWFVDQFAGEYRRAAEKKGLTVYQGMEAEMRDSPSGILVLPHFAGAATPYMDTGAKGAFVGLELSHTPIEILRAIMEGITYEMRLNMEKLEEGGIAIRELHATGGCAKSKLWLQMKADILGVPVTKMGVSEAGTIGGIILTGVATGAYASEAEASRLLVKTLEVYTPRKEQQSRYEEIYRRYQKLYAAVRPLV